MTDGRRLVELHYGPGRHAAAAAACDLVSHQATVASFLRQFGFDETSNRHLTRSTCVDVDHILDEVGGRVVDPTEWNTDGINLRSLRDGVKQLCRSDQKLTAFMQKLGIIINISYNYAAVL